MSKDKSKPVKAEDLPYRPCVGIMVLNREGLVWAGAAHSGWQFRI